MDAVDRIIIIVAIIILIAAVLFNVIYWMRFRARLHFQCPHCGYEFKPNMLKMILIGNSGNVGTGKIIKCPNCGKKDYMEPKQDAKN